MKGWGRPAVDQKRDPEEKSLSAAVPAVCARRPGTEREGKGKVLAVYEASQKSRTGLPRQKKEESKYNLENRGRGERDKKNRRRKRRKDRRVGREEKNIPYDAEERN